MGFYIGTYLRNHNVLGQQWAVETENILCDTDPAVKSSRSDHLVHIQNLHNGLHGHGVGLMSDANRNLLNH